jgi:hypothetical protein
VRFFFDNCLSINLTKAMRLLNEPHHEIQHLTDRFDAGALDPDWLLAIAAEKDLILVSGDPAITSSKKEKEAWRSSGLTSFFFGGGFSEKNRWVQTLEVVRYWPEIVQAAREAKTGTGFLLPLKGTKPKLLYDRRGK